MNLRFSQSRRRISTFFTLLVIAVILVIIFYPQKDTRPVYPSISNGFQQADLKIDRTRYAKDDIIQSVQEALPSFPISFWEENQHKDLYFKNRSCARFPNLYTLRVNNIYWQTLGTSDGIFHLLSAYYDVRKSCQRCPLVRIIGMVDRISPSIRTYCQLWFADHNEPVIVPSGGYDPIYLYPDERNLNVLHYGYLITCPIPRKFKNQVPIFVSLVENECDIASNSLRVIYNKLEKSEKKSRFAVCVKASYFYYEDFSVRLIEWIELLHLLGAHKTIFYSLHVHKNMSRVLEYYKKRGKVEEVPFTYCGNQPNMAALQHLYITENKYKKIMNEDVSLNDCFYKNMYKYDYIVILDVDEMIVPRKDYDWYGLIEATMKKADSENNRVRSHFIAKNTLFTSDFDNSTEWYEDIPTYMYMMQHVLRNKTFWNFNKSFFNTEEVEIVWNHWPNKCLRGQCEHFVISTEDALLQHYRHTNYDGCDRAGKSHLQIDTAIWKYKEPLINRVLTTMNDLGYFG